jgi:mannose-6-phosphate isomerase-like protein (cupin superfamily)
MVFTTDDTEPKDSVSYRQTETSYDGLPGSFVPIIPPHWHKYYDEHMHVTAGRVEFTLDGKSVILKPGDPPLVIERCHVHSVRFLKGEAATFVERTNPTGEFKQDFFENLLDDGPWSTWTAFRAFYYGDTYAAMPGGFKIVDEAVTLSLGWLTSWVFPQKHKGMLAESMKDFPVEAKL